MRSGAECTKEVAVQALHAQEAEAYRLLPARRAIKEDRVVVSTGSVSLHSRSVSACDSARKSLDKGQPELRSGDILLTTQRPGPPIRKRQVFGQYLVLIWIRWHRLYLVQECKIPLWCCKLARRINSRDRSHRYYIWKRSLRVASRYSFFH